MQKHSSPRRKNQVKRPLSTAGAHWLSAVLKKFFQLPVDADKGCLRLADGACV